MSSEVMAIPSCLTNTVCPNCGYSLIGLAADTSCPECGRKQDQSEIILYGWARGKHETIASAKQSRMFRLTFFSLAWALSQWFVYTLWDVKMIPLYLLGGAVPLVYLFMRRKGTLHPGQIQVRLNATGCVQYDDLAGSSLLTDLWNSYGWIVFAVANVILIIAIVQEPEYALALTIATAVCVFLMFLNIYASGRYQINLRRVREGAIADVNEAFVEATPWSGIDNFSIKPTDQSTFTLQINRRIISFKYLQSNESVVDAEIICTPQQAEELRKFISGRVLLMATA